MILGGAAMMAEWVSSWRQFGRLTGENPAAVVDFMSNQSDRSCTLPLQLAFRADLSEFTSTTVSFALVIATNSSSTVCLCMKSWSSLRPVPGLRAGSCRFLCRKVAVLWSLCSMSLVLSDWTQLCQVLTIDNFVLLALLFLTCLIPSTGTRRRRFTAVNHHPVAKTGNTVVDSAWWHPSMESPKVAQLRGAVWTVTPVHEELSCIAIVRYIRPPLLSQLLPITRRERAMLNWKKQHTPTSAGLRPPGHTMLCRACTKLLTVVKDYPTGEWVGLKPSLFDYAEDEDAWAGSHHTEPREFLNAALGRCYICSTIYRDCSAELRNQASSFRTFYELKVADRASFSRSLGNQYELDFTVEILGRERSDSKATSLRLQRNVQDHTQERYPFSQISGDILIH